MKKLIFILSISVLTFQYAFSQDSLKPLSFKDRIEPGLILGGDFVNNGVLLSFIPYISYDLRHNLMVGVSPNLSYYTALDGSYSDLMHGGSVFGKLFISKSFYGQLEFETLNRRFPLITPISAQRKFVFSPFIGGGYRKDSSFGYTFVSGLFNLRYDSFSSPYPRAILIRAGISIRLNSEIFKNI
jgi:hypothetical protein